MPADADARQLTPRLVELVGLAGAGKTSLSCTLAKQNSQIFLPADLQLRKPEHLQIFLLQMPSLLPLLAHHCRSSCPYTWVEMKAIAYLEGWDGYLKKQAIHGARILLLDHGPLFKLATLHAFQKEKFAIPAFERWWNNTLQRWSNALDLVIWLDAPQRDLLQRINDRAQRHPVKGMPAAEAIEFFARYRVSYQHIRSMLVACGQPPVVDADTSQVPLEQLTDQLLSYLVG